MNLSIYLYLKLTNCIQMTLVTLLKIIYFIQYKSIIYFDYIATHAYSKPKRQKNKKLLEKIRKY
jgi:hypothetical protein